MKLTKGLMTLTERYSKADASGFSFRVFGKPVSGKRPRVTRRGTYKEAAEEDWKLIVGYTAKRHVNFKGWDTAGRFGVHLMFATDRRADLDNLAKPVMDALQGICWRNDNQLDVLQVQRVAPVVPGVFVRVWRLT